MIVIHFICNMHLEIIEDRTFTKITAETITGKKQSFENCKFISCDFSYADLSGIVFMECRFDGCNLSLIKLSGTGLQNVIDIGGGSS